MTWIETTEVLGNLGDFLGSVAVLATLLYLAAQTRAIRKQAERDHLSAEAEIFISQGKTLATDPELRRILLKARTIVDPDEPTPFGDTAFEHRLREGGMTDEEILAADAHYHNLYIGHLNAARTAPTRELAGVITRNFAMNIQGQPLVSLWWESVSSFFEGNEVHADFAKSISRTLKEVGAKGESGGA